MTTRTLATQKNSLQPAPVLRPNKAHANPAGHQSFARTGDLARIPAHRIDSSNRHERHANEVARRVARGSAGADLLPRQASNSSPSAVPESLSRSQGQPLDSSTRRFMETRMGQDFQQVRIHTDKAAADSARQIQAVAYTAGQHVAFAPDRYQPTTPAGRNLLAHELTHVVQQSAGQAAGKIQRLGFFETIGVFLGLTEGSFSDKELKEYLDKITKNHKIEDSFDSDNKARAIVRKWKAGSAEFNLTGIQKALLIQEMDTGWVGSEDQRGILDLLENSDDTDLRIIFTSGGIKARTLISDFGGSRLKELKSFFNKRFKGGLDDVLDGLIEPQRGIPASAPKFPYSWTILKAKIDADAPLDELLRHIAQFSTDDQEKAIKDLTVQSTELNRKVIAITDQMDPGVDSPKNDALKAKGRPSYILEHKIETLLEAVSKDVALGETAASLQANTKAPTAAQKVEIAKALKPDRKTDAKGNVVPFQSKPPGETTSYEEKLVAFVPGMIDDYFQRLVVGKGKKEHDDKNKVHPLKQLEEIGNVSKDETDKVFGAFYDKAAHPALKADTRGKRGNIHDLFADTEAELAHMKGPAKQAMAKKLMFYFFQSNGGIQRINRIHSADPQFAEKDNSPINDEAKTLEKIAVDFTKTPAQVKKLNEIDRNWPASADSGKGEVNIQVFKKDTPDEDRDFLWDMFQTLIHEYIHTLADQHYFDFANSFGGDQTNQFNTLVEGVDSYLDEVVWTNVQPHVNDPVLREKIEGPVDAKKPPIEVKPASRRRYASYAQAMKLINIVGPRNLYAAYFLGKTDRLGA